MAYLTSQGYQPYSDPYFQDIGYGASGSQYQNLPMSYAQSGQPQGGAQIAQPPSSYQQLPDWAQKYYGSQMQGIDPSQSSLMQKQFYNDYQMHAQASPNMVDPITGIYTPWAIQQGLDPSVLGAGQYRMGQSSPISGIRQDGANQLPGQFTTSNYVNPWSGAMVHQTGNIINPDGSIGATGFENVNGVWTQPGNYSQTTIGQNTYDPNDYAHYGQSNAGATTTYGTSMPNQNSGYAVNRR